MIKDGTLSPKAGRGRVVGGAALVGVATAPNNDAVVLSAYLERSAGGAASRRKPKTSRASEGRSG
jgi:hypothetical protein